MDKIIKMAESLKLQEKAKDYDTFFDQATDSIGRNADKVFDLLVTLDPETHSVSIAYLLVPLFMKKDISEKVELKQLIIYTRNFIYSANVTSLQYSSLYLHTFYMLVRVFTELLLPGDSERPHYKSDRMCPISVGRPVYGIKALRSIIQKLGENFTPCHRYFACLCLSARNYKAALPVISKKIFSGYDLGKSTLINLI